jgi:hypothetical protein
MSCLRSNGLPFDDVARHLPADGYTAMITALGVGGQVP